MFFLLQASNYFHIHPRMFTNDYHQELLDKMQAHYSNKVLHEHGLAITIAEVDCVGAPRIFPDDGGTYTKVTFKVLIFRPSIGETINGRVGYADDSGFLVTLGFFQDIFVPKSELPPGSSLVKEPQPEGQRGRRREQRCWVWYYKKDEQILPMKIQTGQNVRVKVLKVGFTPPKTVEEKKQEKASMELPTRAKSLKERTTEEPMHIVASINGVGLGMLSWWRNEGNESDSSSSDEG